MINKIVLITTSLHFDEVIRDEQKFVQLAREEEGYYHEPRT